MLITDAGKSVIPFRARDAKRVGEGCFYLDLIIWLSGDRIELGDRVGFNYGCYVNGYGGLAIALAEAERWSGHAADVGLTVEPTRGAALLAMAPDDVANLGSKGFLEIGRVR